MRLLVVLFVVGLTPTLMSCSTLTGKDKQMPLSLSLDDFLPRQERISWQHLQRNISPREPKVPGGPKPLAGIVVAGLSRKDPDYYFHWTRDSANVMHAVVAMAAAGHQGLNHDSLKLLMVDFLQLSDHLQKLRAPNGLGEPRYTVDGQVDTLPWSRPQFDGPALRALTIMSYLETLPVERRAREKLAFQVLRRDLDFLTQVYLKRGFDIWEELKAENYHTRLVQMVALEKAARFAAKPAEADRYRRVARRLEKALDDHWDPTKGYLRSQLVIETTDGYTAKKTDLDSAVIIAVIEAGREFGGHSVFDDRVQATVLALEELFQRAYPINQRSDLGLAYGRYSGDVYFGGNPWYLITAYYARFYYRLARGLQRGQPFPVTARNLKFVEGLLSARTPVELKPGFVLDVKDPRHALLHLAALNRAEDILRRLQFHIPSDGQIYEQFDKNSGLPVSAPGLGWGHSSFIAAMLERQKTLEAR